MKQNTIWMLLFWVAQFTSTTLDYYFSPKLDTGGYYLTSVIIITIIAFAWFLNDAKEINVKPSAGLKIGVIALGLFFVPYYLIKYKGFKRSLISFSKFAAFVLLYFCYAIVLEYIFVESP